MVVAKGNAGGGRRGTATTTTGRGSMDAEATSSSSTTTIMVSPTIGAPRIRGGMSQLMVNRGYTRRESNRISATQNQQPFTPADNEELDGRIEVTDVEGEQQQYNGAAGNGTNGVSSSSSSSSSSQSGFIDENDDDEEESGDGDDETSGTTGAGGSDVQEVEPNRRSNDDDTDEDGDSGTLLFALQKALRRVTRGVLYSVYAMLRVLESLFDVLDTGLPFDEKRKAKGSSSKTTKSTTSKSKQPEIMLPVWLRSPLTRFVWRLFKIAFNMYIFLSIFGFFRSYFAVVPTNPTPHASKVVPYSEFVSLVRKDKVSKVLLKDKSDSIIFLEKNEVAKLRKRLERPERDKVLLPPLVHGDDYSRLKDHLGEIPLPNVVALSKRITSAETERGITPGSVVFGQARLPPSRFADPALIPLLHEKRVNIASASAPMSGFVYQMLFTLLALWLPLLPLWFFMQRMRDGAGSPAKKSKNMYPSNGATKPKTTFKDVAGCESAKVELEEFVSYLRDPERFLKLGAKPTSGIMMVGPPGTGKTLLARALAGEAGVPFFSVSASEFVEMYVGRGAARVRQLFDNARKNAPCVVFIDEIDAVGVKRGSGLNEERDQTVIQLLTELDGFDGNSPGVLVLAATNRANILDPALLRPGRLSRRIQLDNPDETARRAILQVHLRKVPFRGTYGASNEESLELVLMATAIATRGFSGAQLANVVNEAVRRLLFLTVFIFLLYITLRVQDHSLLQEVCEKVPICTLYSIKTHF